ncbi:zinc finger BED domain-containing protein RICESLEEPER 2-like [Arachis duranensis]|uniref:Zinc finger BED domain-containing protein RICESLEEPER 2-like n=1 Tax=Arachis duranensis TaxID=130453 RepID=A0A6P5N5S6_ARADU|nr:zinc finger BED domain-containing protein RICESLEEPER 2-like [Arachis duranensis]
MHCCLVGIAACWLIGYCSVYSDYEVLFCLVYCWFIAYLLLIIKFYSVLFIAGYCLFISGYCLFIADYQVLFYFVYYCLLVVIACLLVVIACLLLVQIINLKSVFSQPNQNVCLTIDCWSSVQNLNYLCLIAHYIDANWKLQKRILNFCAIKDHKGETIGRKIERCLLSWGISRVFSITVDNASSNDVALSYLKNRMEDWNSHPLRGEFLHEARILEKGTVHLDVPIRWNSTFLMLESALKFQKTFKRLGERDSEFAMMAGGIPRSEDWENARHFVKFLKIFYEVTNKVSGSTFVTSSQHFNDFCKILSTLKHWMGSLDTVLSSMAEKMKSKYDKYWGNIKNTNMMIFIAVVLDPRSTRQDPPEISTQELEAHETSFAMEFEKKMQFNESVNKNEVELYLMEALKKSGVQFDILNWWKVNSTKFPILGGIARDVLAMLVFTVASKSTFSTGGRVLNNYRSSLTPMIAEALICTQNWLRNSPKLVLEELIEELENLELEVAPTRDLNEEDSGVESH